MKQVRLQRQKWHISTHVIARSWPFLDKISFVKIDKVYEARHLLFHKPRVSLQIVFWHNQVEHRLESTSCWGVPVHCINKVKTSYID